MSILDELLTRAKNPDQIIVLADGTDERSIRAAEVMVAKGFGSVVLIGAMELISSVLGDRHPSILIADPLKDPHLPKLAEQFQDIMATRGKECSSELALERAQNPLYYAALLLRAKRATCVVAGSLSSTADVLRGGIQVLGTAAGISTVSSYFLMVPKEPTFGDFFLWSDCGVVPQPNPEQLADIAICTADTMRTTFGREPKVALLSFSTHGSAKHADVDKVRETLSLVRQRRPDLAGCIDGELQFDAALVPAVAARKVRDKGSPVAGKANIFIFPDLDAGNIAYKVAERLGGVRAIGPVVQGLALPYFDLSRGCSVEDIVYAAALGCVAGRSEHG